jgi:hypothetical protein
MENDPDYSNVSFIDEYPELAEKVRIRRLCETTMAQRAIHQLIILPLPIRIVE